MARCFVLVLLSTTLGVCRGLSSPVSEFTSCGVTGAFGPTQAQCNEAYKDSNKTVFSLTVVDGVQLISLPFPGVYRIKAFGAGGNGNNGGLGAFVSGEFALPKGAILKLLVGQQGEASDLTKSYGGGGGSFITRSGQVEPLLVAGGAASSPTADSNIPRIQASLETFGNNASQTSNRSGTGGLDGEGGYSGIGGKGGGGGGFNSGGQSEVEIPTILHADAFNPPNSESAATGGRSSDKTMNIFRGGFGGGGYALQSASGGGGGYSGGGGASDGAIPGGGGSFISGMNTKFNVSRIGPGLITLQLIESGIETKCSEHSFTVTIFKEILYGETEFTLLSPECVATSNETHVILTSQLDSCGTEVFFKNGTTVSFKNVIKRSSTFAGPFRYLVDDIDVTCSYSIRDAVTLNILPEAATVKFLPESEEGDFLISTKAYPTSAFEKEYTENDFPLRVTTDDHIFLEVGLSAQLNFQDIVLQLDNCFASSSMNFSQTPKHAMIDEDCGVDITLEFLSSPNDGIKRFMFKPVAFAADNISTAYIHCEVSLCQSTDTVKCRTGCRDRQKRHIVDEVVQISDGSQGYGIPTFQLNRQKRATPIGPFVITDSENGSVRHRSAITLLVTAMTFLWMMIVR